MALIQKNYMKDHLDGGFVEKQILPEHYFSKCETPNSTFFLDYNDYSEAYKSQRYKYAEKIDKEKCLQGDASELLLNKCNMTMENSLSPPLVPAETCLSKNCHIFPPVVRFEALDPSLMIQNFIDPQLFSERDIQEVSSIPNEIQLLSPPYSSIQYDKNFSTTLDQNCYREQHQEGLDILDNYSSHLQDNLKDSIHHLSSQIFSPPMSPQNNSIIDPKDTSYGITYFDKPSFNQFMAPIPLDNKNQHTLPSSNEIAKKSMTFGRFSSRRTMVSLEAISSYIQGPEKSDGKFVCLYNGCLKRFGRKYNIQSHIQTHLSDRPYCCPICRVRFVRHHDLKRHIKIHGDQKPYVCPCGKSFVRTDALKRHRIRGICKGSTRQDKTV
ncbi:hypothetical protein T552_02252 [Pneumocystis carinii B80]|uniref:C2H2-type domain-containing protein n=2 Tax=Pneumocystis carinii TaxID=4754 RepID=A0A0W4ZFY8_PNEC8|nr:hypothetical protein T552_02252 [Pneumocystis carinii B80]ADZ76081.1 transcription factor [Pneumocystis carinii]KTW27269.1 hypothetical protein T552_02252 [Pneumocystis carinii B80]